jgi:hypothetical protein
MTPQVEYIGDHQIMITIYDLKGESKEERMKGRHIKQKQIVFKNNHFEDGYYQTWEMGENNLLLTFIITKSFSSK